MTIHQAKQDAKARLHARGVQVLKVQASTVSFQGFGYGEAIFVTATIDTKSLYKFPVSFAAWLESLKQEIPPPSHGGYILRIRLGPKAAGQKDMV